MPVKNSQVVIGIVIAICILVILSKIKTDNIKNNTDNNNINSDLVTINSHPFIHLARGNSIGEMRYRIDDPMQNLTEAERYFNIGFTDDNQYYYRSPFSNEKIHMTQIGNNTIASDDQKFIYTGCTVLAYLDGRYRAFQFIPI